VVDKDRFAESITILKDSGLPRQEFQTMGQVFKKDGLVSSPTQERAQMIFALSQELSGTVSEIDGLSASCLALTRRSGSATARNVAGRRDCAHQVLAFEHRRDDFIPPTGRQLKQEIGLGHYEARGWRGFHHHGTLCIAAYRFLISERETIPPSGPRSARRFAKPAISSGYRPRGATAPSPTAHPQLNRDRPLRNGGRNRPGCCRAVHAAPQISTKHATKFMTQ
jgi:hypothetical protein